MNKNMKTLITMGYTNRELNLKALTKAKNDIIEAVTILTSSTYFNDDVIISNEPATSTFIDVLTKEQIKQQQQQMVR